MMPRLDGFGLVKALRTNSRLRDTPIILLSARAGDEAKVEGLDAGADDYLVKPFSARELLARVQANLQMALLRKAAEADLRKRTNELEAVLDTVPAAVWFTHDRDANYVIGNKYAAELLRLAPDANASTTAADQLAPNLRFFRGGGELSPVELPLHRAVRGQRVVDEELEILFANGDRKTILMRAVPLRDASDEIHGAVGAAVDITERKSHEQHQQLLLNELNHRVKNTLATVQSLAMQTLRNSKSPEQARSLLEGRLMALAGAHDVLTRESWGGASLAKVIDDAVAPYFSQDSQRFALAGPDVWLPPNYALALAMALHELATNAVKYGALSNEFGRVRIEWEVVPGQREYKRELKLRWTETGGPRVERPTQRGFGSRLIERGLKQDLGGEVVLDFAPGGVICTIQAPLRELAERNPSKP